MISRVTRLIFVIIPKSIHYIVYLDPVTAIATVLFISNYTGQMTEFWSVSMEMQFYLVSPCIVYFMYKSKAPLTVAIVIALLNLIATQGLMLSLCPKVIQNPSLLLPPSGKCV